MNAKSRTYSELKAEIAALEQQAEAQRQKEIADVVADIRAKVAEYGLTEQDVFGRKRTSVGTAGQKGKAGLPPKYRDPKTGSTWSGRGRAPQWLASVKNRARFLIDQA
ncbi:H-NS histone family protein [Burkholderia cenocepacia]|uniref:H-NS histone family protein n=1 Tax=Burkholderia cenocepacia TaxID=95486 RepID=UPI0013DFA602|nr:H-NS histone family protein [Burkholderia cenocepacia]MCW3587431.1 H-NS histone family protein [Burkholderia cenocepacia]MCW3633873.1 H-NS histone family protein [Burkholderia cenocepacia]MCW5184775.1 H-NS histone family protein [Burkholderia cenocepacia]NGO98007.1 hypothetical protein [Burkholderia cenocepacia]